jgi:hypothetical protein
LAWDPVKQREAWHVEHKGPWNGGTLSTAGNLVFQGTADGKLVAYRADDGTQLWDFTTQTGVVAPPISFEMDGEQYVSVNVGWGGAFALVFGEYVQAESMPNVSRVLTFKLGGKGALPAVSWKPTVVFNPPPLEASPDKLALGFATFQDVKARGMASFADNISSEESEAVRAYVIQQAQRGQALLQRASAPANSQ